MNDSSLARNIKKFTEGKIEFNTAIEGLSFHRSETPTEPVSYMFSPHLCLIAQGTKHVILGNEDYDYDKNSYMISSVDLPLVSKIVKASKEEPYLGLTLELDLGEIAEIISESNMSAASPQKESRGMGFGRLSQSLLDAVERLVELLNKPEEISVLARGIKREIYYRLLAENQGYRLKEIISAGSQKNQISKAISWLKDNFDKTFLVKDLARYVGMSESTFYQHFRSLTAMSPLQYQKKIRLNEAKKLMLIERIEASDASFQVGYESPTQFSREYKKMFGNPPARDIKKILGV